MSNTDKYEAIPALRSLDELFSLNGRSGAIVGGGGKMSQSAATTLALAGANVALADVSLDAAECAVKKLPKSEGQKHAAYKLDSSNEDDIRDFFNRYQSEFGKLDFFIYNVMAKPEGYYKPFADYSRNTWDKVLGGNLTGAFLCSQKAAALMAANPVGGSIVLTSSIYGMLAPDQRIYKDCDPASNPYSRDDRLNAPAAYSASKAGILGLAKYLSTQLADKNIRVNSFIPGGVFDGQEESFHKEYVARTPLNRMAVWSDYNGPLLFLVSDASRYMTGTNLVIDGGWSAW